MITDNLDVIEGFFHFSINSSECCQYAQCRCIGCTQLLQCRGSWSRMLDVVSRNRQRLSSTNLSSSSPRISYYFPSFSSGSCLYFLFIHFIAVFIFWVGAIPLGLLTIPLKVFCDNVCLEKTKALIINGLFTSFVHTLSHYFHGICAFCLHYAEL